MGVGQIDSLDDARVAIYRDLPRGRQGKQSGQFVVEGRLLLERLGQSDNAIESILTDERHLEIAEAHAGRDTEIYIAEKELLDAIIGFRFHRGLLACAERPRLDSAEQFASRANSSSIVMICERFADPVNLGSVIRNAAAFGAQAVLLGPASADPFGRQALRVSMGAVLDSPPLRSSDLLADARRLRSCGFKIVTAELASDAIDLRDCGRQRRVAIVLGNEGSGLDPAWRDVADQRAMIPMARGVDSLNVAAASAVFLHHFSGPELGAESPEGE